MKEVRNTKEKIKMTRNFKQKTIIVLATTLISICLASIFGFLHNQVSFAVSREYFTEFKFNQFYQLITSKSGIDFPRMSAGLVGIISTWWFGLLIGLINGVVGLIHSENFLMQKTIKGSLTRTLLLTITFSLLGLLVGKLLIINLDIDWFLPEDLTNQNNFLIAGTMHTFSYIGGTIGLFYGVIYQFKTNRLSKTTQL